MKNNLFTWCAGLGVLVLAFFIWSKTTAQPPEAARTNREVALLCTTDMATRFHIHPTVKIVINGEERPVPANIGIETTCMNSLHTHDATGIIHVEAPEQRDFTLGDLFAVWGETFNPKEILGYRVDEFHKIIVTVNGAAIGTFDDTILHDQQQIIVTYEAR